jgi:oligopeptide/dipeptide ABC transporter ATP-binding protein
MASARLILADGALVDTGDAASVKAFRASHASLVLALEEMGRRVRADEALSARIRRKFAIKNTTGYSLNALVDFDDPLVSLDPLVFALKRLLHTLAGRLASRHLAASCLEIRLVLTSGAEWMRRVRLPAPETRMDDYPHQFSGGMRQRVVGAISIACEPKLLIADEATTALDSTIQAQYLDLLRSLQRDLNLALLFITHDFGIVAKMCDDVAVMYAGRIVENCDVRSIFNRPAHPYTTALLDAVPRMDRRVDRLYAIPGATLGGFVELAGCSFANRCPLAQDQCRAAKPPRVEVSPGHISECWRAQEVFDTPRGFGPGGLPQAGAA